MPVADKIEIGFGGSCHWCTEAIFLSLKGVDRVRQGWIAGENAAEDFSEAVLVRFDPEQISQHDLIEIHLHTHSCTADHALRSKYRSAIYIFSEAQASSARQSLVALRQSFTEPVVTEVVLFSCFKENQERYLNYYYSDPQKPFCRTYIEPKLRLLMERFSTAVNPGKTPDFNAKGFVKLQPSVIPD